MSIHLPKIINSEQTKLADQFTIENEPIASIDLMERASEAFVEAILPKIDQNQSIDVVCGIGNNGGDGLAVTRILQLKGFQARAILIKPAKAKLSQDSQINFKRLQNVQVISEQNPNGLFEDTDVIIDAIFGSGLNRPVKGFFSEIIGQINQSKATIISIDIPSGMFGDELSAENSSIICADFVVSFQRPKLSFFLPESDQFIKEWETVDIGLGEDFIQNLDSNYFIIDDSVKHLLKNRKRFSHKGTYGHSLIIAGSYGKMGAAVLSTKACLRSGAGLVTAYIPKCGYEIMQTAVPEAMCLTDQETHIITNTPDLRNYQSIGIGPGIGTQEQTKHFLIELLDKTKQPLVLDADALNVIAEEKLYEFLPKNSILTPHPGEFERLVGKWNNSMERIELQLEFSKKYNCYVVLKDAHTTISTPEGKVYFNTSGNPGMATGGSGDVLTGIITGLLAQNYSSLEAALIGVYYHGVAGDKAAAIRGQKALIASDIIKSLRII